MTPRRLFRFPWRDRQQIADEFETELAFHFESRMIELTQAGVSEADARVIATREMGDVDDARRYVRATDRAIERSRRRREILADLGTEARQAIRRLRRAPVFALTAVVTLALGIGGSALMFSLVSGILLRPLPYGDPSRLAMVWGSLPQQNVGFPETPIGGMYFKTLRENASAFRSLAAFRGRAYNLGEGATVERVDGVEVTGDFFDVMGVAPRAGRFFHRSEETPGSNHVVVIGDELWRRRFGGQPRTAGQTVLLNGEPYTVLGIAPPGFAFPIGKEMPASFQLPARPQIWVPMMPPDRGPWDLAVVARLGDTVSYPTARADLDRMAAIQERLVPQAKGWLGTALVPLKAQAVGGSVPMLASLVAAVALLLLIACVNTAQLVLAEMQARRRDISVRLSLGGSTGRIAAGLVMEVSLVALAAGALGIALGSGTLQLIKVSGSARLPRITDVSFEWTTALLAIGVALASGLLASGIPAVVGGRIEIGELLRRGGRDGRGRALGARARRAMIAAELALSVVLVASAGLLIRSLTAQLTSATGFTAPDGLTFEVTLPSARYTERQGPNFMEHPEATRFLTNVLARIRAVPGVTAAAIGKPLPLSGAQETSVFAAEGIDLSTRSDTPNPMVDFTVGSPQMFAALGTPMVAGREFTEADREGSLPVVIVNRSMARWLWPGQNAIGKRLRMMGPPETAPWMSVIGVSADLKRYTLVEAPRPEMIVPYSQKPYPTFATMQFVIRTPIAAGAVMPAIRAAIAAEDPSIPVSRVRTIGQLIGETSANARFATWLMTAFGAAALVLSMVGLYGVVAHGVSQRRPEFGVRRALGATPRAIGRLVVREGLRLVTLGVGLGLAFAVVATRALRGLLYGVTSLDPVTYASAIGLLVAAAILACLLPARRASRVDPRVAMED